MTRTKHTKGPWFAVGHWVEVEDHNTPDICNCDPVSMGQGGKRSDEEICANAKLIAAAPDLLADLKFAVKVLRPLLGSAAQIERMESTIAKAEGR